MDPELYPQASSSFSKQKNLHPICCLSKGEKIGPWQAHLLARFSGLSIILISVCLLSPCGEPSTLPSSYIALELHTRLSPQAVSFSPRLDSLLCTDIHYTNAALGCFFLQLGTGGHSVQSLCLAIEEKGICRTSSWHHLHDRKSQALRARKHRAFSCWTRSWVSCVIFGLRGHRLGIFPLALTA